MVFESNAIRKGCHVSRDSFNAEGITPVIPTPFTEQDQIDWANLRDLVDFACSAGAAAICLPAYGSEFYKLTEEERRRLVVEAIDHARDRIPVIAQCNSNSAAQAASLAREAQQQGAAAVCVTVPRVFPLMDRDLGRYFDRILNAIDIPLMIQDFSPNGSTLSPAFVAQLHRAHPHFRFLKLEDPMIVENAEAIRQITGDGVGVLEGLGGLYMFELLPGGVRGFMPGLGLTDLLVRIHQLYGAGCRQEAFEIFRDVLPHIVFSMRNFELFHRVEKALLHARGVLRSTAVREAALHLSSRDRECVRFLNAGVLALLDELRLPRNPASVQPANFAADQEP